MTDIEKYLVEVLRDVDKCIKEANELKNSKEFKDKLKNALKFIDRSLKAQIIAARAILVALIELNKKITK